MEEDKLLQERKKKLIVFLKKDRLTSAFIFLAAISFLFFAMTKLALFSTIPFPPLRILLSVLHTMDELSFIMNGWLLLALLSSLSAILSYHKKLKYIFYPLAAWVLWLSIAIRLLPLKINPATGKPGLWDITKDSWTLGPDLDPFLFLRWAKEIVSTGTLYALDTMRFVPLGFNVKEELVLHVYLIAWFHKLALAFGSPSIDYSAIIYPVFMFALTIIAFFFFVKKVFIDNLGNVKANLIAIFSSFLFAITPSILPRTVAGIPEKEASGFLFLFLAFYFFLSAWKSHNWKAQYTHAILSAVSTALMALVWGGYIYIYLSIALASGLAFLIGQVDRKRLFVYSIWLFLSIIIITLSTARFTLYGLLTSTNTALATAVFGLMLIYFLITNSRFKAIHNYSQKGFLKDIPPQFISLIIILVLGILASFIVGPSFLTDKIQGVKNQLVSPTTDRLGVTVAENRQPFFDEWVGSFGPPLISFAQFITFNQISFSQALIQKWSTVPIFFWLFFFGSICLFFYVLKSFSLKDRLLLTSGYAIFIFGVIFSRYRGGHILNGTSSVSLFLYALGFFALLFVLGAKGNEIKGKAIHYYKASAISLFLLFIWITYYQSNTVIMIVALLSIAYFGMLAVLGLANQQNLKSIDSGILLLFSFFFLTLVSARGAVRLIMMIGPSSAIIVSSAVVIITAALLNKKYSHTFQKAASLLLILLLLSLTLFSAYAFFEGTKTQSRSQIPYSYSHQWQKAMSWVRENTPENAVFGHWWDYGYWLQSIGERATVLDGGNAIPYWNHLMGRHALTGRDNQAALDYLYAHKTTHFLIDSTDIGKYSAFSSIGSDINYDRQSFIPSMSRNNDMVRELKNGTELYYFPTGKKYESVMPLDEPIKYSNNGTNLTLEPGNSVIVGIKIEADSSGKLNGQPQLIAIYVNKNKQQVEESFPMRYAYYNGEFKDFNSGIESGAFFMQRLNSNGASFSLEGNGALLYLSKRTVKSQLARLYLYEEDNPYFKLVHTQDSPIVEQTKSAGAKDVEDIIFYGGVQGPIRIWEINYPDNMALNNTYLSKQFLDTRLVR